MRTLGGRSVPVSLLTDLADDLVAVHGQADQQQLLRPGRAAGALDRFAGPALAAAAARLPPGLPAAPRGPGRARRADRAGTRARPGGRLTCAAGWPRSSGSSPPPGEDVELRAEEERLAHADALHTAASAAHDALLGDPSSGSYDLPDAVSLLGHRDAGAGGGRRPRPGAGRAGGPAVRGGLPGLRRRRGTRLATSSRWRPTRPGWPRSRSGAPT